MGENGDCSLLIEWIRKYVVSGSQDFTCDIGEVGISFNFLTAENLSTNRLANSYLLAKFRSLN